MVAAQLAMGIGFDAIGVTGTARTVGARTLLGDALLVIGAVLVVRGS